LADFASGLESGARAGALWVDSFSRGFEGTRKLFLDAEHKKAATAAVEQLKAAQAEYDNQEALIAVQLGQLEEDALRDGVLDDAENRALNMRKAKLEMGRFTGLMDKYAQTLAGAPDNPHMKAAIEPLMNASMGRFQGYYNELQRQHEERALAQEATLAREAEAGADRRQVVAGRQALLQQYEQQIGGEAAQAQAHLYRLREAEVETGYRRGELEHAAGMGMTPGGKPLGGKGAAGGKLADPLAMEDVVRATVEAQNAAEIKAGSFGPEKYEAAADVVRRKLFRLYGRLGAEAGAGAESILGGGPGQPEGQEMVARTPEEQEDVESQRQGESIAADLSMAETQLADLQQRRTTLKRQSAASAIAAGQIGAAGGAEAANFAEESRRVRAEAAELDADIEDARNLRNDLKARLADLQKSGRSRNIERNRAEREQIRQKYGKQ
jgi:hypothetical protein